jgi:hypothetical protein
MRKAPPADLHRPPGGAATVQGALEAELLAVLEAERCPAGAARVGIRGCTVALIG